MPPHINEASEFLIRQDSGRTTLEDVLHSAERFGGEVLASCVALEGDHEVFHVTVADEFFFAPHFRENYSDLVELRPVVVLSGSLDDDLPHSYIETLNQNGIELEYSYCSTQDDGRFYMVLYTSDVPRSVALLRTMNEA